MKQATNQPAAKRPPDDAAQSAEFIKKARELEADGADKIMGRMKPDSWKPVKSNKQARQ